MEKSQKNKFIIFVILFLVSVTMCLFWNITFRHISIPIQHTTGITSGEFKISTGIVHEILIKSNEEKTVCLELVIFSGNDEEIWRKQYDDINLTNNFQTIDVFENAAPLELERGQYRAACRIEGKDTKGIQFRFIEYNYSLKKLYTILCVLVLFGAAVVLLVVGRKDIPLEKAYIIIMLTMGVIFNFVLPPLGVPDEESHFLEAYCKSSKMVSQKAYGDETRYQLMRADDYDSILYLHNIASISEWYDTFAKGDTEHIVHASTMSTVMNKAPYVYWTPALGIAIARTFGCGGHVMLLLGRLFNLLLLTMLVALAIKIIPFGKMFYFILGLLPEVVYLFASYSYDGLNLALCMLIAAYFLYLYAEKDMIGLRQLLLFIVLTLLMASIKAVYVTFGFLVFLLPKEKLNVNRKQALLCIVGGGLGGTIFYLHTFFPYARLLLTEIYRYGVGGEDKISINYVLCNLTDTLKVYGNTILKNTAGYMKGALGQIIGSGRYGGQDAYFIPLWMGIAMMILLVISLGDTDKNEVSNWKRGVTAGMGIFIYLSVLTVMYFAWTGITDEVIMGVQGRYFLPIFALAPIVIKNTVLRLKINIRNLCMISIGVLDLLFIFLTFAHYAAGYFV